MSDRTVKSALLVKLSARVAELKEELERHAQKVDEWQKSLKAQGNSLKEEFAILTASARAGSPDYESKKEAWRAKLQKCKIDTTVSVALFQATQEFLESELERADILLAIENGTIPASAKNL